MSRISKTVSLLFALLFLFSASANNYLIDVSEIELETAANYDTAIVKKDTFQKLQHSSAQTYYPLEYTIKYEGAPAQFVDFHVKRNDEIKVGDLIASFSIQRDEVEITRREMNLSKAEENYKKGLLDYEKRLSDKDEQIALSLDAFEREIRGLEKERILIEREKYIYEAENNIKDLKKSLDDLLKTYENTNLYSDVNGIISEIPFLRDMQWVYSGTMLMKVYDPSVVMYKLSDDQGKLRYNMDVMVAVGRAENRVTGMGRVAACPMAQPGGSGDSTAYIVVDEFSGPVKTQTSPSVSYYAQYLENVFVVDRAAITTYSGRNFVYKLSEDGMVSKRYVSFALGSQQTGAVLVDGVTEGEKLIIDD